MNVMSWVFLHFSSVYDAVYVSFSLFQWKLYIFYGIQKKSHFIIV